MNTTIRQLAMQYFNKLDTYNKSELSHKYYKETIGYNFTSLTGREIENIFYQEVIVKWFQEHPLYHLCNGMQKEKIIAAYLEEHTKEQPMSEYQSECVCENECRGFVNVKCKHLPQSVLKTIDMKEEFDKWLDDKKFRYSFDKEMCYQDILSSTTSAIDQYLKSPYQAQKGVLESAVKCNEMFLEFVDNSIDVEEVQQAYFKCKGVHSVNELEKMCQQYKDYVSYINSQPKAIEDNVWDEVLQTYFNERKKINEAIVDLEESADYSNATMHVLTFYEWLEQNYSLIKK